jgi:hypothetical protein
MVNLFPRIVLYVTWTLTWIMELFDKEEGFVPTLLCLEHMDQSLSTAKLTLLVSLYFIVMRRSDIKDDTLQRE